ncbi:MAG TPA: thermonuclease family protein [Methylomirabilota bacterium]|nr:thermonuclease family protein [Methylomirabilota bacterium]
MRARLLALLLALAGLVAAPILPLPWCPSPCPLPGGERVLEAAEALTGIVVKLVDGDTVWVRLADRVEKVRYIGVDTPEVHHPRRGEEPGGREAAEVNRRLVDGKAVRLEPDVQLRDRYGRLLAYVWVKGADGRELMVNAELVRLGYARIMTVPPNVRHVEMLRKLQVDAREHHRGLWAE